MHWLRGENEFPKVNEKTSLSACRLKQDHGTIGFFKGFQ
jgi:hypothetical protein